MLSTVNAYRRISCCAPVCRLPPPTCHVATWHTLCELTALRSLSLAHSKGITAAHIAHLSALTRLESLDLRGVKLPLSTLNTFAAMQSLTQLRIPKVTIVRERFLQLHGDAPTCPHLAAMLEAMPRLRHLDLYWVGKGDGQSIMKVTKHMRTLAAATQLRCPALPTAGRLKAPTHRRPHRGACL
jgi:hypothetical protein